MVITSLPQGIVLTANRYPQYGFATHKGYGTPEHVEALRAHGPCAEHRDLFVRTILAGDPPPAESTDGEFSFE